MKFLFLCVCLASGLFAIEDLYKNYGYLSLGVSGTKDLQLLESQQLGLGYRIHHKTKFFVDASDISISILSNKVSTNTYTQSVFPRVLFLHNFTKTKPLYVGFGAAYLKAKIAQTKEHFIGGFPVKIREAKKIKDIAASMAIGKTLYKTPSLISFAQLEVNIPSAIIMDTKNSDFIGASFTINAGF